MILSAGSLGSPHLLLKSGIGAAQRLEEAGLRCQHELPGVGENLQDHLQLRPRVEMEIFDWVSHSGMEIFRFSDSRFSAWLDITSDPIFPRISSCRVAFCLYQVLERPKFRVRAATLNSEVGQLVKFAVRGGAHWLGALLSPTAWRSGWEFLTQRKGPVSMAASQVCAFVNSGMNLEEGGECWGMLGDDVGDLNHLEVGLRKYNNIMKYLCIRV